MRADILQRRANGGHYTRGATCECGEPFTQFLVAEAFVQAAKQAGGRAFALLKEQVPDYYVPVFCPRCERKDLVLRQRRDAFRAEYGTPDSHERQMPMEDVA
jgi:hypothetical protein